jgi:hypothetical protein
MSGRILKGRKDKEGFMTARLTRDGGKHYVTRRIHELVAEAFLWPCPKGMVLRYKDGNKTNNRLDNLEYVPRVI